jgi:hypothetical protein
MGVSIIACRLRKVQAKSFDEFEGFQSKMKSKAKEGSSPRLAPVGMTEKHGLKGP